MRPTNHRPILPSLLLCFIGLLSALTTAQNTTTTTTSNPGLKRGISWIGTNSASEDNSLFTANNTPITWYKSWSPYPIREDSFSSLDFAPMIHGLNDLEGDIDVIRRMKYEHVLTFNEPDGDTSGGGTDISPHDAAVAWAEIVKLRDEKTRGGGGKKISTPATVGNFVGFDWLQKWNESCWEMYEDVGGCEFDFVAAHWYGGFEGLAGWMGQLHEAYPDKVIWVTELAMPQPATVGEVQDMMERSLAFLDQTEWIERYAWFGGFRTDEANGYTGDVVALFDKGGGLTELGALYMGGEERGFEVGETASESAAVRWRVGLLSFGLLVVMLWLGLI